MILESLNSGGGRKIRSFGSEIKKTLSSVTLVFISGSISAARGFFERVWTVFKKLTIVIILEHFCCSLVFVLFCEAQLKAQE